MTSLCPTCSSAVSSLRTYTIVKFFSELSLSESQLLPQGCCPSNVMASHLVISDEEMSLVHVHGSLISLASGSGPGTQGVPPHHLPTTICSLLGPGEQRKTDEA